MGLVLDGDIVIKQDGYTKQFKRRKYWRLSYECYGSDYINGTDGDGVQILRKHEREDKGDYIRRKETATPWCFVSPILRKYNDFVHRKPYTVDKESFEDLIKDVDSRGTKMDDFMKKRVLASQIDAVNYILLDTTSSDGTQTNTTVAQQEASGDRIFWRAVNADQVIQWKIFEGALLNAAILMCDINGQDFIWYVTPTMTQRFNVEFDGDRIKLQETFPASDHNWGGTPLVPLRPDFGSVSQAAPIAELQKAVTRERSLLDEELWNNTYTQMWAGGVSAENFKNVAYGPKQVLCLPSPQSTLNALGSDVNQAASIRTSIADNVSEIGRVSGADSASVDGAAPESGFAKSFRFNDLAANLAALAKAAQDAHRRCEVLTRHAQGKLDHVPVVYPNDFTMPILQNELTEVMTAIRSQLPQVLIDKLVKRFADRNIELSDEERDLLETQMEEGGVLSSLLNPGSRTAT